MTQSDHPLPSTTLYRLTKWCRDKSEGLNTRGITECVGKEGDRLRQRTHTERQVHSDKQRYRGREGEIDRLNDTDKDSGRLMVARTLPE